MGMVARMKSASGRPSRGVVTIASATTITIPNTANDFNITGTTAITNINYDVIRPGRIIRLSSTDATGAALTDTAIASTAAKLIHTVGSITVSNGRVVELRQAANGSWWQSSQPATLTGPG